MIETARRIVALLAVALVGLCGSVAPAQAQMFSEAKYAAIVIDASSGEVLFAKRADSPRYPASITKIMTLYLAFEALASGRMKPADPILVSPRAAAAAPSRLGVAAGQTITAVDAIQAIAVKSANDMSVAMAEHLGGTESRFAALMTLKAQQLGMKNTRFVNASGLPDSRQISTARDIAILSRAVLRDFPQYYAFFSQKTFSWRGQTMKNHNGLLFRMPGVDGIKTGFTNASGYNLAASAVRDGRRLITVVMGGTTYGSRDAHVAALLDTGFDVFRRRASGESITVAQSYFEHMSDLPRSPVTYAAASSGSQGRMDPIPDPDPTSLQAALRPSQAAAIPAESRAVAAAETREAAPHAQASRTGSRDHDPKGARTKAKDGDRAQARPKRDPNAVWLVQVGAFRQKAEARRWLKETERRFAKQLAKADGAVIAADGWYRTRFEGLTRDGAEKACKAIRARKLACMVARS